MKTVWRFPFTVSDSVVIEMPVGASVLPTIDASRFEATLLFLWAEVDPDRDGPKEDRVFRVVRTGHELKHVGRYIGTARTASRTAWHVYEGAEL
ncbi:DUF7352 domain-containing protein [Janibacter sp. GS2]|uniref:DUF7352 domain-containing protein n=1 Tax=Janibacter sp. GS2 TaxID=3442646 RepID=UPI003EBB14A6